MAGTQAYEILIRVRADDKASKPLRNVANALGGMGTIAGGILAAGAITAIGRAIGDVGRQALTAAGYFQGLIISYENLIARQIVATGTTDDYAAALGQAKKPARDLLDWVKEIAVTTPFTVKSISRTTQLGMAMGFTTDESKDMSLAIGNFTAGMGLGNEVMERIIYNFGQMRQQGKVTGTELRDLARGAMVPVTDVLHKMQENMGLSNMSFDEFSKQAREGKLDVNEFFIAFQDIANEQFPGAMERMSQTWQGVTSNAKDFVQAVLGAEVLGPVVDRITKSLSGLLQKGMSPELRRRGKEIGAILGGQFDRISGIIKDDLLPAFRAFAEALGLSDKKLPSLETILYKVGDAIASAVEWVSKLVWRITSFLDANPQVVQTIKDLVAGFLAFFAAQGVIAIITGVAGAIAGLIGFLMSGVGLIALIIGAIVALGLVIYHHREQIVEWLVGAWETIKNAIATAIDFVWQNVLQPFILWFSTKIMPTITLVGALFQAVFGAVGAVLGVFWAVAKKVFGAIAAIMMVQLKSAVFALKFAFLLLKNNFDNLVTAAKIVWSFLKDKLQPIFKSIREFIVNLFNAALQQFKMKIQNAKDAIVKIIGYLQTFKDWLNRIKDTILNIKLPDWLTPGSPTPFELGLLGINDALQKVNRSMAGSPLAGGATFATVPAGVGGGAVRYNNVTVQINGANDPDAIVNVLMLRLKQQGVFS